MVASKLVRGTKSSREFFYAQKEGCRCAKSMKSTSWTSWRRSPLPPPAEGGLPVKVADKLRALEMLYKHLGLGDGAKDEGVVIVDE